MLDTRRISRAFTLIELLVVVAIISILIAILLPGLSGARESARRALCAANLHSLGHAFHMYAGEHAGRAMPAAYTAPEIIGGGPPIYWWGSSSATGVDHTRGFTWPYLQSDLRRNGVYECPNQPWGSYVPQTPSASITSTYGYNGYFLCPPHTPGYSFSIGHRPWQRIDLLREPQRLFVFGDAGLDLGESLPRNSALLDPPMLFGGSHWTLNSSATTSFRHAGKTVIGCADGHAEAFGARGGRMTSRRFALGSVGSNNDPYYVPDWREW